MKTCVVLGLYILVIHGIKKNVSIPSWLYGIYRTTPYCFAGGAEPPEFLLQFFFFLVAHFRLLSHSNVSTPVGQSSPLPPPRTFFWTPSWLFFVCLLLLCCCCCCFRTHSWRSYISYLIACPNYQARPIGSRVDCLMGEVGTHTHEKTSKARECVGKKEIDEDRDERWGSCMQCAESDPGVRSLESPLPGLPPPPSKNPLPTGELPPSPLRTTPDSLAPPVLELDGGGSSGHRARYRYPTYLFWGGGATQRGN